MAVLNSANPGAAFAPTEYASFLLETLSAQSVALQSGVKRIETNRHELHIPRMLTDVAAAWTAEGADLTPTDPTADSFIVQPSKVTAFTKVSNESVADSDPAILEALGRSMMKSLSLKIDKAFFEGSGTAPEPKGMGGQTGINTVTLSATPTNLDAFSDAIGALAADNASAGAIVLHPTDFLMVSKLKEGTTSERNLLQMHAGNASDATALRIQGVPVYQSTQVTVGTAYVYDPSLCYMVIRDDISIEIDNSVYFGSDSTAVRARARVGFGFPYAAGTCKITGLNT